MTAGDVSPTVEIEEVETTLQAGETLTVSALVEVAASEGDGDEDSGNGEGEATELPVELLIDGETVTSETSEIVPDESASVELEWTPGPEDVGSAELGVEVSGDTVTESITVADAPAEFAADIEAADEHLPAGGTASVTAAVENTGTTAGSTSVEFRVAEDTVATEELDLAGQEHATVEFTHDVAESDSPEVTLTVATDDNSDDTTVAVVTGSVTIPRTFGSKGGMGVFGWLMFLGMVILLVPLLPVIAVIKLFDILFGGRASEG